MTRLRGSRRRWATLGLVAVLLAGCGDDEAGSGTDGAGSPPEALPGSPPPEPAQPTQQPLPAEPEMVAPREDLEAVEPHPWDEIYVLNQGRAIELRWTSPPCRHLHHIELEYSEQVVTVTLFLGKDDADEECDGLAYRARVRGVPEPIGNRSLADGAEL